MQEFEKLSASTNKFSFTNGATLVVFLQISNTLAYFKGEVG